jgi:hypothetical protein
MMRVCLDPFASDPAGRQAMHEMEQTIRRMGTPALRVLRGACELGIYAVEHTAPSFLVSLALRITRGSVSNPHERVRRLSHYDPASR